MGAIGGPASLTPGKGPPMRRTVLATAAIALAVFVPTAAQAITNGVPDNGEHPQVGQLLFYVPDEADPRFEDGGSWFNCTGTLVEESIVVTAGHCTYATGIDGESSTTGGGDGSGGTDVWINFTEAPDYSILPPSSSFVDQTDGNQARYEAWSGALDADADWNSATATPHPDYDDAAFYLFDLGVLELDAPFDAGELGTLPEEGRLDQLAKNKRLTYTAVGYGLEGSGPKTSFGGDTRRQATLKLVNTGGSFGTDGATAKFSANNGKVHQGGTCSGDSGGPVFESGTNALVGVVSFGVNTTCAGTSGIYRLDTADDLDFLAGFGVTP